MEDKVSDQRLRRRVLPGVSRTLCGVAHLISCFSQQEHFALARCFCLLAIADTIPPTWTTTAERLVLVFTRTSLSPSPIKIVLVGLWFLVSLSSWPQPWHTTQVTQS